MPSRSLLPTNRESLADSAGKIGAPWYRFLAKIERLIGSAATNPGTGLTVSTAGVLTIADNGVGDNKLRDSLAMSVIGRPLDSEGDPQDIVATANGRFLQRDGDVVSFRYPKLPSFTVATVPSAADQGAGTIIFVSNETGGATVAFSDATNWRRVQDRVVIS